MNPIDPDIQAIIDANERLMAQVEQFSFEKVCRDQGVDPQGILQAVAALSNPQVQAQVQSEIAQDRQDMQIEIEAEAERRGLKRPATTRPGRRVGIRI